MRYPLLVRLSVGAFTLLAGFVMWSRADPVQLAGQPATEISRWPTAGGGIVTRPGADGHNPGTRLRLERVPVRRAEATPAAPAWKWCERWHEVDRDAHGLVALLWECSPSYPAS